MFEIVDGELISYNGNCSEIVIPSEVTSIKPLIFRSHLELRKIDLSNCLGIEKLATKTFFECKNISEIILPCNLKEIGFQVFSFCQNLDTIIIPDKVTIIGSGSFEECMSLVDITIPKSVVNIEDHLFKNCAKLERVTLSDGLIFIGEGAFENCKNLERITLPNTIKKISMFAFRNCRGLVAICLPNQIKMVERGCFYGCVRLVTVLLPKSLERIDDWGFRECKSLNKIDIPVETKISPCAFLDSNSENEVKYKDKVAIPKKAKCYVATCVYGSYDCSEVWVLRRYRDNYLKKHWYGKMFIRVYYFFGPIAVKLFGKQKWFNKHFKKKLDKKVWRLKEKGYEDTFYYGE